MFRKPSDVAERNKSLMRKKEVNKLKGDAVAKFSGLQEEQLAAVFAPKASVEQSKLMSKTLLYHVDGVPCFLDESGRNRLYPTLQLLWRCPGAVRTFVIHSQVSRFVLNGADLMLPGVATLSGLEGVQLGEVCAVRVLGNPLPFAVGASLCSWEGILANRGRGKALEVLQCFGDLLSGTGMGFTTHGPNAGFQCGGQRVLPLPGWEEPLLADTAAVDSDAEDGDDSVGDTDTDTDADGSGGDGKCGDGDAGAAAAEAIADLSLSAAAAPSRRDDPTPEQRAAMGMRLRNALLLLLKHVLKDRALPALVNVVWPTLLCVGAFLYSTQNPGLLLDRGQQQEEEEDCGLDADKDAEPLVVKRSQHRTVGAFLQWAQREGVLGLEENADKGTLSIVSVARTHRLFRDVRLANPDALKAFLDANGGAAHEQQQQAGSNHQLEITISDVLKVPRNMRYMLQCMAEAAAVQPVPDVLTSAQLKALLAAYFKAAALGCPENNACVVVPQDDHLWEYAVEAYMKALTADDAPAPAPAPMPAAPTAADKFRANFYGGDNDDGYDDDGDYVDPYADEDEKEDGGYGGPGGGEAGKMVAGVWMPAPSAITTAGAGATVWDRGFGGGSSASQFGGGAKAGAKPISLSAAVASSSAASLVAKARKAAAAGSGASLSREEVMAARAAKKVKKNGGAVGYRPAPTGQVAVRKDLLMKLLVGRLKKAYSIQKYPGAVPIVAAGLPPKVELVVQLVRARKHVTHVRGLEEFGVDLPLLAREMQRKFAASASVGPCANNPQKREVYVQGNLAREMEEFLVTGCGFKRSMLQVELGKAVKAKK